MNFQVTPNRLAVDYKHVINVHPTYDQISQVLADLVQDLDWKSYTILYENYDGLRRLEKVLLLRKRTDLPFVVRLLTADNR